MRRKSGTLLLLKTLLLTVFSLAAALMAWNAYAASQDFQGIQKLMSSDEFAKAGLHKQTPEELKALNAWLVKYTAHDAAIVRNTVDEVRRESKSAVSSFIDGKFSGWQGETIFHLKNGQVWKQRIKGRWKADLESPEVVIRRNLFGYFEMKVKDTNKKIGVKRIK